jgi:hypothetical protein
MTTQVNCLHIRTMTAAAALAVWTTESLEDLVNGLAVQAEILGADLPTDLDEQLLELVYSRVLAGDSITRAQYEALLEAGFPGINDEPADRAGHTLH